MAKLEKIQITKAQLHVVPASNLAWLPLEPVARACNKITALDASLIPEDHGFREYATTLQAQYGGEIGTYAILNMLALAGMLGSSVAIKPYQKSGLLMYPNTFGGLSEPSGSMKSARIKAAFKPVLTIDKTIAQNRQSRHAERQAGLDIIDAEIHGIKVGMKKNGDSEAAKSDLTKLYTKKETLKQAGKYLVVSDATMEKLGHIMQSNPSGIIIFRDELAGLFSMLGRENQSGASQFILEMWEGAQGYSQQRMGRGDIYIESCTGTIAGCFTNESLAEIVSNDAGDGMLQRLQMLVIPDHHTAKSSDTDDDVPAQLSAFFSMVYKQCAELIETVTVTTTEAGTGVWRSWMDEVLAPAIDAEESAQVRSHLSKYRSLCAGLALQFAIIRDHKQVSDEDFQTAICWCTYLEQHARKLYGLSAEKEDTPLLRIVKCINTGKLRTGLTVREIVRRRLAGTGIRTEQVQAILSELEDLNWLKMKVDGRKKYVQISPLVEVSNVK